jgi:hypothetical protein
MANLDALRKIIREEVQAVFQQELAEILKEAIRAPKGSTITEAARPTGKPVVPATMNRSIPKPVAPMLSPGNPLNSLLQETAMSMTQDEFGNFNGQGLQREAAVVESVDGMFASARKSSNLEHIEINDVPDFSHMMSKMGI